MLHSSEQQKNHNPSAHEGGRLWTRNADSNSTEEDDMKDSCRESGISQTYQQPGESAGGQTLRDDDQVIHQQTVEESSTERGLEHYDQQARRGVTMGDY